MSVHPRRPENRLRIHLCQRYVERSQLPVERSQLPTEIPDNGETGAPFLRKHSRHNVIILGNGRKDRQRKTFNPYVEDSVSRIFLIYCSSFLTIVKSVSHVTHSHRGNTWLSSPREGLLPSGNRRKTIPITNTTYITQVLVGLWKRVNFSSLESLSYTLH